MLLSYAMTEQPCKAKTSTQSSSIDLCPCKPLKIRVRYGETLIGTGYAGNPMAGCAIESAVILAHLILVGQPDGYQSILDNLYRHKQRRLHQLFGKLRPTPYAIYLPGLLQHV